jgi:4-diphosphocytidyl-2-C-methyl-D-erythritol kinase
MATRVRSYSKINLGLGVGPLRGDGFHSLATVYQTLALHDVVTVSARVAERTRIELTANHPGVPRSVSGDAEKNTAWRIVAGALERLGLAAEVVIDIDKRLPVQGGMGAGSANAAAALIGLEKELGTGSRAGGAGLEPLERLELAAQVGSDVPLFLLGGTVLGAGRGEQVTALQDSPAMACVVAVPGVGVSTKAAFAALDERPMAGAKADALTFQQGSDSLEELSRVYARVFGAQTDPSGIASSHASLRKAGNTEGDLAENPLLALVRTGIENDFEEVVFSQHPSLRSTKRELMGLPGELGSALYAALSGSGSALFGLYASQADAIEAQRRVLASGVQAILTETLPRSEYWHTMFAE